MDSHPQALRHMKSRKTLYTFWTITSRSIRSIIWIISSPSLSCVSSNLSWEIRLPRCVRRFSSVLLVRRVNVSVVVSGDHTRTIQIATPTVGGLMKFAVKTKTCLGCKTALKPTNSVPGGGGSFRSAMQGADYPSQMAPFVITVEDDYQSCTTNRSNLLLTCRRGSLGYGRSANAVRDPFIKSVLHVPIS